MRTEKIKGILGAVLCLVGALTAEAKVTLPALVSDGMVVQREQPVRVWGKADAGETVSVTFRGKTVQTAADEAGRWVAQLPSMKAGGPYEMQINEITLHDIWVGDVWLCSGQSNMELPVHRVTDMFADEIAAYENPQIRHFKVPNVYNFQAPQEDLPQGSWKPLTQENVMDFSALAYFFAKEMYAKTGVAIGLINSSWGGTPIESWISEESLQPYPVYVNDKRRYEDEAYCKHIKEVEGENFYRWNVALYAGDPGLHAETPWYSANLDDSDWTEVDMFARTWGNNGLNPTGGSHWLRKSVEIPADWEGQEAVLRLGCIVDADSVYVNGQFVGTTGYQYPPRIYRVPAGLLKAGTNHVTVRLISNGGQPSFVPEKSYKLICNGAEVSLEGMWKYRLGAPMPSAPDMMFFCYKPVCLYNAMIAPLRHCALSGVIWYQGESNVGRRNEYAGLMAAWMADWRKTFEAPELPFYIVELADFLPYSDVGGRRAWAEMRQEQAKGAAADPHATLIRNSDLGEWNDIHPLDKKTLGNRVAEAAWKDMNKNK